MSQFPVIVISAGFMVSGAVMLTWACVIYRRGQRSMAWPSVDGIVTSSSVRVEESSDDDSGPSYYPSVSYDYQVGGKTLQGERIGVGGAISYSQAGAAAIAAGYAVGKKVPVYYDPADPSYAVLQRGSSSKMVAMLAAAGAISLVFAVGAIVFTSLG